MLLGVTRSVGRPIVTNVAHSIGRAAPDRLSYVCYNRLINKVA